MQPITYLLYAWLNRPAHHALQEHTQSLAQEIPEVLERYKRVADRLDRETKVGRRVFSMFTPPEGRA
jgi:hypothetical protein